MTGVPESAAAVARRMQEWREGRLAGVDSAALLGAVRDAVNEASESLRKVREWCDAQKRCAIGKGCVRCAVRAELVEEVRNLLPPLPEAAEEVDMDGTRVTRDDREYPGDDNHWRVTGGGENEGVDTGN